MRKIFEIRKDLSAKIAEVKALDPKQNAEAVLQYRKILPRAFQRKGPYRPGGGGRGAGR